MTGNLDLVDIDHLTKLQALLAGGDDDAVDVCATGCNERRSVGSAGVGDERHDPVESFTRQCGRDLLVDHAERPWRWATTVHNTNSAPPMSIAMSATLKIGNHWKSMKSTTAPRRN